LSVTASPEAEVWLQEAVTTCQVCCWPLKERLTGPAQLTGAGLLPEALLAAASRESESREAVREC
jgi:hypothetical protein